jgi:hypothetical protein
MQNLPLPNKWLFSLLLISLTLVLLNSCKHDPVLPEPGDISDTTQTDTTGGGDTTGNGGVDTTLYIKPCDPDTVYFERDLLPIFISNCAMSGCHDATSKQDDIILDSYENIINTGRVRAGRPDNSDLFEVITESDPDKIMPPPPNTPLSSDQIDMIRTWIEQGAQNLSCGDSSLVLGCDTADVSFANDIQPIFQTHCLGCHSGGAPSAGINLSSYTGTLGPAQSGQLYGSVAHLNGYSPMPQGGAKLSDCQINRIKAWVDQGTKDN